MMLGTKELVGEDLCIVISFDEPISLVGMSMVQSTLLLGISGVLLSPSKKAAKND